MLGKNQGSSLLDYGSLVWTPSLDPKPNSTASDGARTGMGMGSRLDYTTHLLLLYNHTPIHFANP